jgi:hypothetical protein
VEVTVTALWTAAHGIAELAAQDAARSGGAPAGRPELIKALLDHPLFGWNAPGDAPRVMGTQTGVGPALEYRSASPFDLQRKIDNP